MRPCRRARALRQGGEKRCRIEFVRTLRGEAEGVTVGDQAVGAGVVEQAPKGEQDLPEIAAGRFFGQVGPENLGQLLPRLRHPWLQGEIGKQRQPFCRQARSDRFAVVFDLDRAQQAKRKRF